MCLFDLSIKVVILYNKAAARKKRSLLQVENYEGISLLYFTPEIVHLAIGGIRLASVTAHRKLFATLEIPSTFDIVQQQKQLLDKT